MTKASFAFHYRTQEAMHGTPVSRWAHHCNMSRFVFSTTIMASQWFSRNNARTVHTRFTIRSAQLHMCHISTDQSKSWIMVLLSKVVWDLITCVLDNTEAKHQFTRTHTQQSAQTSKHSSLSTNNSTGTGRQKQTITRTSTRYVDLEKRKARTK